MTELTTEVLHGKSMKVNLNKPNIPDGYYWFRRINRDVGDDEWNIGYYFSDVGTMAPCKTSGLLEWKYIEIDKEIKRTEEMIPRSVAFAIANRFYGSDYPMQRQTFDNAAAELGYPLPKPDNFVFNSMTQEKANLIFQSELGQQLSVLYVTSDGRAFIRHEEAVKHADGKLDPQTNPLDDKNITEWYPE